MTSDGNTSTSQWGELALWGDRVVAFLVDALILFGLWVAVTVASTVVGVVSEGLAAAVSVLGFLGSFVYLLYTQYLQGVEGGSPGKQVTGLKVVRHSDGAVIGGGMGVVRYLAHFVDGLICNIGYLFPLWDPLRQTIADKIVGTVVIKNQRKSALNVDMFRIPKSPT